MLVDLTGRCGEGIQRCGQLGAHRGLHARHDRLDRGPAVLVGDITHVRTWEGWLYLATVIDYHTKAIIGRSMAEHMRADLACDAITTVARNVDLPGDPTSPSNRGNQDASAQLTNHLKGYGITSSIGRGGACWDNAMAESFFAALKNGLVYRTVFPTRAKARTAIAEYIDLFYNRQRIHSPDSATGLHWKSPTSTSNIPQPQHRTVNVAVR